jgi:hypothetical protein
LTTKGLPLKPPVAALAAKHGVSAKWLRLIAFGVLDDPAFVEALRTAAQSEALWELVAPSALEALVIPTLKLERLGGSLDDLLFMLLETMKNLRHPANQNFARQVNALEYVNQDLDFRLQSLAEQKIEGIVANTRTAGRVSAAKKRASSPAGGWLQEVQSRKPGLSKEQKYRDIEKRERLQPGSVKKAILRFSNHKKN